jgi:hypothetical protein
MTTQVLPNGSEIAIEVRESSAISITGLGKPRTLGDLLTLWDENPPREEAMLRTTCARLADFFKMSVGDISIDSVHQSRKGFRPFLEGRKYGENSVRTYVNHVRILLNSARTTGWEPTDTTSEEWRRVIALAAERNCADLARHLSAIKKSPRDVTSEDVDQWIHVVTQKDLSYARAIQKRCWLWRILRDGGYAKKMPKCILREKNYGIALEDFPTELKAEVSNLLKWKQAKYAWNRPYGAHHREVTSKRLRQVICAVYGYVVNIYREQEVTLLSQLAQPHIIGSFVEWCMSEREVKGQTLQRNLRLLAAVLNQHPNYKSLDRTWFKPLLDGIPTEPKSVLKKRKAEKYLPFSTVQEIPTRIRATRSVAAKRGRKQLALVARNELLLLWVTVLPWRQRNIRECRIGGPTPNLYKGPVPAITDIDMPGWAAREQQNNPAAEFWQFHFSEEETKTGVTVDALLPRQLIKPLEEYMSEFRNNLIRNDDPGTLFLNENGKPMSLNQVTNVISTQSVKHGGTRITPHLYRDIVAYAWLKDHPKDFLTLSKLFWHSSPNEVIRTYGGRFNESSGVCSMEAWLDEREAKREA